jgi:hypothetical protein
MITAAHRALGLIVLAGKATPDLFLALIHSL